MKKRILSLLLALALVLTVLPVLPAFATDYDLKVCGTTVTSANCADVLGTGKVEYLPGQKILYIRNDLVTGGSSIVESSIDGLTIYAAKSDGSKVTLTCGKGDAFVLNGNTYVKNSNMSVTCTDTISTNDSAFYVTNGSTLWFTDSEVSAKADYTIWGTGSDNAKLGVRNSKMTVSCYDVSNAKAVGNFNGGITLENCYIVKPDGGKVNAGGNAIVEADGTTYAKYVEISDTLPYGLWIAGTQVTSKNQYNILGDGKFQFYEPRTLYIKGDCICDDSVIYNEIDGLIISTDSSSVCQLISAKSDTIVSKGSITFSAARLSLSTYAETTDSSAIYLAVQNKTLTFSHCGIYASGDYTIYGEYGTTLDVISSDLKVDATDRAVAGFSGGITFDSSYIEKPADAVVNTNGIMESDGSTYAENVVIKAGTPYDITIAGVRVNTYNCSDVLGDGVFKYDNASKTLTINGDCSYAYSIINSAIANLKIVVKGDSKLTTTAGASALFLKGNTLIQSENDSKLTIKSANCAVNFKEGTGLEFKNANLIVDAPIGIVGNSSASLSFTNTTAEITSSNGAVYGFNAVNITGAKLLKPEGGKVDGGKIVNADGSTALYVVIGVPSATEYDLRIAGTQVTSANAADILGDGAFSYDAAANKLTVKGSCTDQTTQVIVNYIPNLTIYIAKDVTLSTSSDNSVISSTKDVKITGSGKLTVKSNGDCGVYIRNGSTLTIENANLEVDGRWGIAGNPSGEKLVVKNSTIHANGTEGAICDFDGGITITGCEILEPAGGKIGTSAIVDSEGNVVFEVLIGKAAALVNPFVDVKENDFFYDAVLWAYYHDPQITTGTNANHFSPGMACSRAQVVTFLWRAKGCPAPTSTEIPFSDVPAGQWFTDAVLWAVENEITTGTGGGRFSPNMACSRSQVVTFLWRTRGKPAPSSSTNPFSDVPAGQWFTDAVLWAVEKNITGGTGGGKFSPNMTCSRGQIVTFLYRDMAS